MVQSDHLLVLGLQQVNHIFYKPVSLRHQKQGIDEQFLCHLLLLHNLPKPRCEGLLVRHLRKVFYQMEVGSEFPLSLYL